MISWFLFSLACFSLQKQPWLFWPSGPAPQLHLDFTFFSLLQGTAHTVSQCWSGRWRWGGCCTSTEPELSQSRKSLCSHHSFTKGWCNVGRGGNWGKCALRNVIIYSREEGNREGTERAGYPLDCGVVFSPACPIAFAPRGPPAMCFHQGWVRKVTPGLYRNNLWATQQRTFPHETNEKQGK